MAEKYESSKSPVRSASQSARSESFRQRSAVRRSCQTIAGPAASPVARSQRTVVSRWFVRPMAAIWSGPIFASARAEVTVAPMESMIAFGSCSTQPDFG